MANRQQREQYGQAQEDKLQHAGCLQGAKEHKQGKDAPQAEVHTEEVRVWRVCQAHFRHQKNRHQRQPEAAVGGKSG